MTDHNGDFSPEAEYKRKMKREKVQRSRIRKKIEEGRATAMEIAAIDAWDNGEDWNLSGREPGGYTAQERAPKTPRVPRMSKVDQIEGETPVNPWGWKTWAGIAAFIGFCVWAGRQAGG